MKTAAWLFLVLPQWYFGLALKAFAVGAFAIVPAVGALSLAVGAVLGLRKRRADFLLFLLPVALSHVLVATAGAFRGQLNSDRNAPILLAFMILQALTGAYLVYRAKGARIAAGALFIFTLTYALVAAFVAAMAFSDSWL